MYLQTIEIGNTVGNVLTRSFFLRVCNNITFIIFRGLSKNIVPDEYSALLL